MSAFLAQYQLAIGVAIGVLGAALVAWLIWPPKPENSFLTSMPYTLSRIDEVCDYHLSGRWFSDQENKDEQQREAERWHRFAEAVGLLAVTFEEASLICTKENGPLAIGTLAQEICKERRKQSEDVKVSYLRSIGEALRSRFPGACPGQPFLLPPSEAQ